MHPGTTGVLLAALLVIPTCLGLWRGDDDQSIQGGGMVKRLLERRVAQRRLGNRQKDNRGVNYYFLGIVDPAGSNPSEGSDAGYDRRMRNRRAEDAGPGSRLIEPADLNSDLIKPWSLEAAAMRAAVRRSAGEAARFRGRNDAP
jgi:hypothetical protein